MISPKILLGKLAIGLVSVLMAANPTVGQDISWKHQLNLETLRLKLSPLSGDGVKAFFIGRGFSSKHTSYLAEQACVFRSDIGFNAKTDGPLLEIAVDEWIVDHDGKQHTPRLRKQWQEHWQNLGVDEEQQTAFHWAMFPTRQKFATGDYNWGMFGFMLPPGAQFELTVVWYVDGQKRSKTIKELECGK